MTTALIQSNNHSAKMNSFTSIESLRYKIIAILFALIASTVSLHAQTNSTSKLPPVLKVGSSHKVIQTPVPLKYSKYTVLVAKNFPIIKDATQTLSAMEETEFADCDLLCLTVSKKEQSTVLNAVEFVHANKTEKHL